MNTCSTCCHLKHLPHLGFPVCGKITHGGKPWAGNEGAPFIHREDRSGEAHLSIHGIGSFGCTLHEAKPAEPKLPGELWGVFSREHGDLIGGSTSSPFVSTSWDGAQKLSESYAARPTFVARIL